MASVVILVLMSGCTRKNPQTEGGATSLIPSASPASYLPRIGVAVSTGGRTCVSIQNGNLAPSSPVTLVSPTLPQTFTQAEIGATSSSPCPVTKDADATNSNYDVHVTGGSVQKLTPLIAVLGSSAVFTISNNNVQADLDQNGNMESFRACSSNDGIHLTVWSGTPLTGTVLWRGYYYEAGNTGAGPPCTPKETSGPG
jgi:hypothetical protein